MSEIHPFIGALESEAKARETAEAEFRREMNRKVAELAEARAFAFRRMNVMRALFDMVSGAKDREAAIAKAVRALRDRLGWVEDSEARTEVLERYAGIAAASFDATHPREEGEAPDPATALAEFEEWYASTREKPFWVLFEHYMPETQLVDF
jgi:CHAD domain-containing protein